MCSASAVSIGGRPLIGQLFSENSLHALFTLSSLLAYSRRNTKYSSTSSCSLTELGVDANVQNAGVIPLNVFQISQFSCLAKDNTVTSALMHTERAKSIHILGHEHLPSRLLRGISSFCVRQRESTTFNNAELLNC